MIAKRGFSTISFNGDFPVHKTAFSKVMCVWLFSSDLLLWLRRGLFRPSFPCDIQTFLCVNNVFVFAKTLFGNTKCDWLSILILLEILPTTRSLCSSECWAPIGAGILKKRKKLYRISVLIILQWRYKCFGISVVLNFFYCFLSLKMTSCGALLS